MSTLYPIPRQTRQAILTATEGQAVFGPFDFVLFGATDLQVRVKPAGDDDWTLLNENDWTATPEDDGWPSLFTLTLDDGLAAGTQIWVKGARLHERQTNVTLGGAIKSVLIERELDRQSAILQELRRDADSLFAGTAGELIAASGIANDSAAPGGSVAASLTFLYENALRSDAAQAFTAQQKIQGLANLGLIDGYDQLRIYAGAAAPNSWNVSYSYGTNQTPIQGVSNVGGVAVYGASRSADGAGGASAAIGVFGKAFNDRAAGDVFVWGGYFEGRNYANGGGAHGAEIDISNFGTVVATGPYAPYQQGTTQALWLACGGDATLSNPAYNPVTGLYELTAASASLAIGIVANGAAYQKGIMFGENALAGADGTTGGGYALAIVAAQHHDFEWWRDNGGIGQAAARIRSHVTTQGAEINFVNDALEVRDITDTATWLRVEGTASTVNGIRVVPGVAGSAAGIYTYGASADIDLVLSTKGSGILFSEAFAQFNGGLQAGAAGAQSGYLGLFGVTSGAVYLKAHDVAGSYNFNLPTTAGSSGDVLTSAGGGTSAMTWTAATGSGNIVKATSPTITGTLGVANVAMTGTSFTASNATAYMPQFLMHNRADDATGPYFLLQKDRQGAANNGAAQNGDTLGSLNWKAADTTGAFLNVASLYANVAGAPGAGSVPATLYIGLNGYNPIAISSDRIDIPVPIQLREQSAPGAPAADRVLLFAQDNGAGKTQVMALFSSGAAQQIAIQP